MMTKNPYDVLGVSPNASDDEIKRVYRDLTRKYHPDANVNNPLADLAEEKFKEVQEAYDIIMRERANGGNSYGNNYGYGSSDKLFLWKSVLWKSEQFLWLWNDGS